MSTTYRHDAAAGIISLNRYAWAVTTRLLFCSDERYLDHLNSTGHPESPDRLIAINQAIQRESLVSHLELVAPRRAEIGLVEAVHSQSYIEELEQLCGAGGGALDADTGCVSASFDAALLAVGAAMTCVERLREEPDLSAGFCAVRPPGHHARPHRAMGFCLFNTIAVVARHLTSLGERVLIADFDAHHGNGTQEIFWNDPSVMFVSWHESPAYPGTGAVHETGGSHAPGLTLNLNMAAGSSIGAYLATFDSATSAIEQFQPTWLLMSAGFDAHRRDPLTNLGLVSRDFSRFAELLVPRVPRGRSVALLEGGYDLGALGESVSEFLGSLVTLST